MVLRDGNLIMVSPAVIVKAVTCLVLICAIAGEIWWQKPLGCFARTIGQRLQCLEPVLPVACALCGRGLLRANNSRHDFLAAHQQQKLQGFQCATQLGPTLHSSCV